MAGSSNFQQWNPSAANQINDSGYTSAAAAGAATNSIFASQVANKLFFQVSTFVAALAQALANQGLVLSDSNITTLTSVLANIVVSGVGASPTLGNITCNMVTSASGEFTTGLQSDAGIQAGKTSVSQGSYAVVDSGLALHSGYTGAVAGRSCIGGIVI